MHVFGLDETLEPTLADMTERLDDPVVVDGVRDTGGRVALAVFDCTKPVIAAINGPAVGIGATMTLPMDVRLASDEARIGFVFGKIGIVPEATSSWFLPRIVGISQALEWVYSADILSAEQAREGGLVRSVHPADELMYRNSAQPHPLEAHRVDSLAMFYTSVGDGKEGVRSFLDKRKPQFRGRTTDMPPFYPWWD